MHSGLLARTIAQFKANRRIYPELKTEGYVRGSWCDRSCLRRMWYSYHRVPWSNPFSPAVDDAVNKGQALHGVLQQELTEYLGNGVSLMFKEASLTADIEGVRFMGHCDGVLAYTEPGTPWMKPLALVEIKSTKSFGAKSCKLHLGEVEHYSYRYLLQANRYALGLQQTYGIEVPYICIIVYDVGGGADATTGTTWCDYWFKPDTTEVVKDAIEWKEAINGQIQTLPYAQDAKECGFCKYTALCLHGQEWQASDVPVFDTDREAWGTLLAADSTPRKGKLAKARNKATKQPVPRRAGKGAGSAGKGVDKAGKRGSGASKGAKSSSRKRGKNEGGVEGA